MRRMPRARATRFARPAPKGRSGASPTSAESWVLTLQAQAGNRAVSTMLARPKAATVQRDDQAKWSDADTRGDAWNAQSREVGSIRRVPIEGLTHGNQDEAVGDESDKTTESAAGKAIVLIPDTVKPGQQVDVLFHFHGYTHRKSDPYGGWRQHSGSGTVRDVQQDRIEAQLQASGQASMIAVLPQGVGASDFGGLNVDSYLTEVFGRLAAVNEPTGSDAGSPLERGRLILSGHSGGGDRIANMLGSATGQGAAEVILFEAIHGGGLTTVTKWATGHLSRVAAALAKENDADARQQIVDTCPKLFGYYSAKTPGVAGSGMYVGTYNKLRRSLDRWFAAHGPALGANLADLRARFRIEELQGAGHEPSVRGLGDDPDAGPLTDALVSLDDPTRPSKLETSGTSTWTPPVRSDQVDASAKAPSHRAAHPAATTSSSAGSGSTTLPTLALTPSRVLDLALAHGLSPLAMPAVLADATRGGDSYAVVARALVLAGLTNPAALTDVLFDVAHPELAGVNLDGHRQDLKKQWRTLRQTYARPAIAARRAAPSSAVPVPKAPAVPDRTPAEPVTPGARTMTDEQKKKAMDKAVKQAESGGDAVSVAAVAAVLDKVGYTVDSWFAGMVFDATFLDIPIIPSGGNTPGVHHELLVKLQQAERALLLRFPGLSKGQIAGRMGMYEVSGLRPPKAATGGSQPSAHCFGLAVDINHPTNPFVGNVKVHKKKKMTAEQKAQYSEDLTHRSPRVIERAMLLMHQEKFDIEASLGAAGNAKQAGALWDKHHLASQALAEYLQLAADLDSAKLAGLVTAVNTSGKDSRSLQEWRTLIAEDSERLKKGDFSNHYHRGVDRPESSGYMDLGKELVVALVGAGLLWGGSYNGAKDIMHFDWRGGTITDRSPQ